MESPRLESRLGAGMIYPLWLFGLSLLFLVLERRWPRRSQPVLRPGFFTDLAYLVFNSEYLGVLIGAVTLRLPLPTIPPANLMAGLPVPLQFLVLLFTFDLAQWGIHNLLHRIPLLWRFHKVHHSIVDMDWIGNWRFHGVEIVIYRVLLYPLAAVCGFGVEAMFAYGVFNTAIGHFAHSNLDVRLGPLQYLINGPQMHLWHHTHPGAGPVNQNFAISLSLWDWIFRTAYVPAGPDPARLGFEGIERYPANILTQTIEPLRSSVSRSSSFAKASAAPPSSPSAR